MEQMDLEVIVVILVIAVFSTALLFWLTSRIRAGKRTGLRPVAAFQALRAQSATAVESGRRIHVSVGRASLAGLANPTSMAALTALDFMVEAGCASDVPPVSTVGDGSLLVATQDSLRGAYSAANRGKAYSPLMARYLAADNQAMTFAAGASDVLNQEELSSNLLIGRYGAEIAIITEAAERRGMDQVIGTDDPTGLALAIAATDKVLIGEEMFATGAYLRGDPIQLASLQVQDILRIVAAIGLLLAALFNFVVG